MTNKQHYRKSVAQWVMQFETHQPGRFESFDEKRNYRTNVILDSMTADQLSVVLGLIAIGNAEGYRQAREQRRNLLVGYEAKSREKRLEFKVIAGGAA